MSGETDCNKMVEIWAEFLTRPELSSQLVCGEFLDTRVLDYSLESLLALDAYLDVAAPQLRAGAKPFPTHDRCAAYLGEVIRRAGPPNAATWVVYEDAYKSARTRRDEPEGPGNFVVLQLRRGLHTPVFAKLIRRVINGREDSLHSFARFIIQLQHFSDEEFSQFIAATKAAAARTGAVTILVP